MKHTVHTPHWIRLLVVYLSVPIVLLSLGGHLGWWQGWVYALLIVSAGIGGRIWAERRHPGLTSERQSAENFQNAKPWDKVLAPLMAFSSAYPVVIVAGMDHRNGWSLNAPVLISVLGFVFVMLGYTLSAWALIENRFFYSVVCIRKDQGHAVCDSGPYRLVRHPGYAGSIMSMVGTAAALTSMWALIPVAIALAISVLRTALEDKTLQDELPGYRNYVKRVRFRLVPWIY